MRIAPAVVLATLMTGCASVPMPPGQENTKEFTQTTSLDYRQAYETIEQQGRACFRSIGVLGNGYDVRGELDTARRSGLVEFFSIGLKGPEKPQESSLGRTVTIQANGAGSRITTTGTTPRHAYDTHLIITDWLRGDRLCVNAGAQSK